MSGGFASFADIPDGDGETTSYTVTGLTNDVTYTFEVRAKNDAGASTAASVTATPRNEGIFIDPTTTAEGANTTITILPKGAPFGTAKTVTVVLASAEEPDRAGEDTDFSLANGDAVLSPTNRLLTAPGRRGTYPHYQIPFSTGDTELALTLEATDDTVGECREEIDVYAYTDYGRSTQERITQRPLTVAHGIVIEDDDTEAKVESAVINNRTVTLNFDQAITQIYPPGPGDPGYEEGAIPNTPEQYFTLFTGARPGENDIAPYARSFSLSGRTVTLTFAEAIDENVSAWVRYDRWNRYSPLGQPPGGRCGQAVSTGTWELANESPGGTGTLPALTIADAEGTEGRDASVDFTVTLTPPASETVTVDYRTVDQTATADTDFTATSGTLTFAPGEATKTVSVPIIDDTVADDGETFLLDLYNANGATMEDTESWATGTIHNMEDEPVVPGNALTASFSSMPSEHGGPGEPNRFTFVLTFSEIPKVGFAKLRDHAFTVTGADVKTAQRRQQESNVGWNITVEPDGWGAIAISLPGGRECTARQAQQSSRLRAKLRTKRRPAGST